MRTLLKIALLLGAFSMAGGSAYAQRVTYNPFTGNFDFLGSGSSGGSGGGYSNSGSNSGTVYCNATGGASNTLVCTPSPAVSSYTNLLVSLKVDAANTGATTINVNGLGAKNLYYNGVALTSVGLLALCLNGGCAAYYDGTQMDLILGVGIMGTTGALTALNDSVHAGQVSLIGNITAPSLLSNSAAWLGPNSASPTAYGLQLPTAGPSSASIFCGAALSSSISAVTFCPQAGTGAAIPTGPASSTNTDLVSYSGTAGQQQDSGIASGNVVTLAGTQTLTNKTMTSPVLNGSSGNSPMTITAANCLAATTVNTPCIAAQGEANGLGNATGTGTVTLYTSSAPANGLFQFCPAIFVTTAPGTAGTITSAVSWTTPGGSVNSSYGFIPTAMTAFNTNANCINFSTKVNTTASVSITSTGSGSASVWEYSYVVIRLF